MAHFIIPRSFVRGMDKPGDFVRFCPHLLKGDIVFKLFSSCLNSFKFWATIKGKHLLPERANAFL